MGGLFGGKGIFVALTYKCNAVCKKCMTRCHKNRNSDMPASLLKVLFTRLKDSVFNGVVSVGSGEPLLYDRLEYFISSILSINSNISLRILSNGAKFHKGLPENFFSSRIKWGITLDAFTQENLSGFQYGIDIERVKDNIRGVAAEHGAECMYLNYTLNSKNYHELPEFCRFAAGLGVSELYATELKIYEGFEERLESFRLPRNDEVCAVLHEAEEILRSAGISDRGIHIYSPPVKFACFRRGRAYPVIDVDGSVSLCSGREDIYAGNIADDNIAAAWEEMSRTVNPSEFCVMCHSSRLKNGSYTLPGVIDASEVSRQIFPS